MATGELLWRRMHPVFVYRRTSHAAPSIYTHLASLILSSSHQPVPPPHGSSAAHSDLDVMIEAKNWPNPSSIVLYFNNGAGNFVIGDNLPKGDAQESIMGSFVDIDADG